MTCKARKPQRGQMVKNTAKTREEAYNEGIDAAYREILEVLMPTKEEVWGKLRFSEEERKKYIYLSIEGLREKVKRAESVQKAQGRIISGFSQITID